MDADLAITRVQQQIADAQERAVKAQEVQGRIEAIRATSTSPRRELSVTVDASGRLVAVDLSDDAYDLEPQELGELIVRTAGAAQGLAGAQAVEFAQEAFGEDSPLVDHLRSEISRIAPHEGQEGAR